MTDWNFADVWEAITALQPDRPAVVQGDRLVTWGELNARADALARFLVAQGLGRQAKVGMYLRNCPEYLEGIFGAYKAGLVEFNVNYRYGPGELRYLLDNADAEAVLFHAEFAPVIDAIRTEFAQVRAWICVEQAGAPAPPWSTPLAALCEPLGQRDFRAPWGRSGDDISLLYTGGTTGLPKGVMWRQRDAFRTNGGGADLALEFPPMEMLDQGIARLAGSEQRPVRLICAPLMHGAGLSPSRATLSAGGTIVLLELRSFSAREAWAAVKRHRIQSINLVGSAFAVPLAGELERKPRDPALECVRAISSSGAMFDLATRRALLAHCPNAIIIDKLGASEVSSMAEAISRPGDDLETALFRPTKGFALISDDGQVLEVRPGARGRLASSNLVPLGYYKDPAKTAETFLEISGVRFGVPGDLAEIAADGNVRLLGRASQCINTGGEKVFAEEVEEALKQHPSVRDAAVVGRPDPRFGSIVFAVVELEPGVSPPTLEALNAHAGEQLASYKLPRGMSVVRSIERLANGKVDYARVTALLDA